MAGADGPNPRGVGGGAEAQHGRTAARSPNAERPRTAAALSCASTGASRGERIGLDILAVWVQAPRAVARAAVDARKGAIVAMRKQAGPPRDPVGGGAAGQETRGTVMAPERKDPLEQQ